MVARTFGEECARRAQVLCDGGSHLLIVSDALLLHAHLHCAYTGCLSGECSTEETAGGRTVHSAQRLHVNQ